MGYAMSNSIRLAVLLFFSLFSNSFGQIVVDGNLDAGYTLLATQTVQTNFGNASSPDYLGSELNALYVSQQGPRLYFFIAGNLEGNFNKLEVFFDTVPGGENSISFVPQYDFLDGNGPAWISQYLGGLVSGGPGLTFDDGFEADYHLFFRHGMDKNEDFLLNVDFVNRLGGVSAMVPVSGISRPFSFSSQKSAGTINVGNLGLNSAGSAIDYPIGFWSQQLKRRRYFEWHGSRRCCSCRSGVYWFRIFNPCLRSRFRLSKTCRREIGGVAKWC